MLSLTRRLDVVLLVEVGDADDGNMKLFGHVLHGREDAAHVRSRATVYLPNSEIGAYRIDNNENNIADPLDCFSQEPQIGNQTENFVFAADTSALDNMDPLKVGTGRD